MVTIDLVYRIFACNIEITSKNPITDFEDIKKIENHLENHPENIFEKKADIFKTGEAELRIVVNNLILLRTEEVEEN